MAITSMPTCNEKATNFHSDDYGLLNKNVKHVVVDRRQNFPAVKSKQTTCLEINFCDFCLWGFRYIAVEISRPKMISNEFNGLRKTFGYQNHNFFPRVLPLERFIGRFCMLIKLQCM